MELLLTSRTVKDSDDRARLFHYSLLVDQIEAGSFFCENYGVRVSEEGGDTTSVPGITTSAVRIDELIALLVENSVGPAGVSDVVADWL